MIGEDGVPAVDFLAALSLATDLGTGQPLEHAIRSCVLSAGIGREFGLPGEELDEVYYLTLVHSIGCTSDAYELSLRFGDDIAPRARYSAIDEASPAEVVRFLLTTAGAGEPVLRRVRMLSAALAAGRSVQRAAFAVHCDVAQQLAGPLGMGDKVRAALAFVFERWDGKGSPAGARGEDIPLSARILHAATDADIFARDHPAGQATQHIRERAGTAYDPAVVDAFCKVAPEILPQLESGSCWELVRELEPGQRPPLTGRELDQACLAVAMFVDLKSPYLLGHSTGVADLATRAAQISRLAADEARQLQRAAFLHDLGRVGVSNRIWDKAGPLSLAEWEQVRLHAYYTERTLSLSPALAPIGLLAAVHHERPDGTGYHRGLAGAALPPAGRILAAADAYQAMTQDRPHRTALAPAAARDELSAAVRAGRLDSDAVDCVLAATGQRPLRGRPAWPSGLTDREVQVLRLLVRGLSNKQVAGRLRLSVKTVGRHVENIYAKAGVSNRATAALFAMQHDLV